MAKLLENQLVRYALVLLGGITIGALFYPTKKIEEKITQKYEQQISKMKEEHAKEVSSTKEEHSAQVKNVTTKLEESERKISVLTVQVRDLKVKVRTAKYKIVRPDGTIEEKEFTESESEESTKIITQIQEEFKTKVSQIEERWSDIHKTRVTEIKKEFDKKESEYQKTIASLEKSKKTSINEKSFGLEAGIMSDKNYYGHATMDLWGPIFVGVHGTVGAKDNTDNSLGAGIGLRF
jgi:chromosome segregation ATPase